jgi:hypothetical protein
MELGGSILINLTNYKKVIHKAWKCGKNVVTLGRGGRVMRSVGLGIK